MFGYVKQSGAGRVKIYSRSAGHDGQDLPAPPSRGGGTTPEADKGAGDLPTGVAEEIILVVEDEEQVRPYDGRCPARPSRSIIQAGDANQALEQIAVQPRLDLLFTDIVMLGGTGCGETLSSAGVDARSAPSPRPAPRGPASSECRAGA